MKIFLLSFALVGASVWLNAASLSIAKRTEIDLGQHVVVVPPEIETNPEIHISHLIGTHDGGMLAVAGTATNALATRLSSQGEILWSQAWQAWPFGSLVAVCSTKDGEFVTVSPSERPGAVSTVSRFSSSGGLITDMDLHPVEGRGTEYGAIIEYEDGYLVAGATGEQSSSDGFFFAVRLSKQLGINWLSRLGVINNPDPYPLQFLQSASDGGFLVGFRDDSFVWNNNQFPFQLYRVDTNGTATLVKAIYVSFWENDFKVLLQLPDGGLLFGVSSASPPRDDKLAEHFGSWDYWLVKVDARGVKLWERSFGGLGDDYLVSVIRTDDGGFLVSGQSYGSGVTGNKTVDGDGIWLLKLDSRGLKEAEAVIPLSERNQLSGTLLNAATSYRLAEDRFCTLSLEPRRKIVVSARSFGRPFNLDVSSDLRSWRSMVLGFNGALTLTEDWSPTNRFYRTIEAP